MEVLIEGRCPADAGKAIVLAWPHRGRTMNVLSIVILFVGVFVATLVVFLGAVDFLYPITDGGARRFSFGREAKRRP
jgi:hypothetical protein